MPSREAAQAADDLLNFVQTPGLAEPKRFIVALIAILDQYTPEVIARAVDPVNGIPSRLNVLRLASVKQILDEFNEPARRAIERKHWAEEARRDLEPPRPKRMPEEQARVDAHVERVLAIVHGLKR